MPQISKYNPKYHDDWAWSLAIKGATNEEMAEAFGIATRTFIRWTQTYPSLAEAVRIGKDIADAKIEKALYERAVGYETEDNETSVDFDKDGNPKPVRKKTVRRQMAPDTMACMYWLNNRKRGTWSQRQEVAVAAADDTESVVIYLPEKKKIEECQLPPEE